MTHTTLEQVLELVEQLSDDERAELALRLASIQPLTLSIITAKRLRQLEQGEFDKVESLRNKYAEPSLDISDEELRAGIREFSTQWKEDLDDLIGKD